MKEGVKVKKLKRKRCKECKGFFDPMRPLQYLCNTLCAIAYTRKLEEKKKDKEWKDRKREGLEKLKTLSEYEKEARVYFQQFIRLRDAGRACISCGVLQDRQWQGSHYLKAEIFSGLIFNEKNVHKSCVRCNLYLNGNELGYREGLIKRYGEDYVKELEALKDQSRNYKYSKEELIHLKKTYQIKIKTLKGL